MAVPPATALDWSPLLLAALAATAWGLENRLRAASRAADPPGFWRFASALSALVLLAIAFVSPVATTAAHYLLTAHLIQVTLVMGFVPPLILLALPPRSQPALPRRVRTAGAVLAHPAVAIFLVNVVFFAWHVPAVYDACLRHNELYSLQQVSLLAVSIAFWWPIVEPHGRRRWSLSRLGKLGYILLATVPQTFAGVIFAVAHRPFYQGYVDAPIIFGVTHSVDQQVAGACMALLSKLALFAAFSVVMWRLLDPTSDDGADGDDGGGGRSDAPQPVPPGFPTWVRLLRQDRTVDEPRPRPREPVAGER